MPEETKAFLIIALVVMAIIAAVPYVLWLVL